MKDFTRTTTDGQPRLIRRKKDDSTLSSLWFGLTIAILLVVALFFVQQRIDYTRTEKRVRRLMIEKRQVISSILPLKLEERYLTRISNIERATRSGMYIRRPPRIVTIAE